MGLYVDFELTQDQIEVFRQIQDKIPERRPLIFGINGYDASGKTEFALRLHSWLHSHGHSSHVIHLDDFHNPLAKRREGRNENQAYIDNAFNLELLASLLRDIRRDQSLRRELTLLDLETDSYTISRLYDIDKNSIILVEGVLLFRPPVNQYIDFRIYLHAETDFLLQRNIARAPDREPAEVEQRFRSKYLKINNWYYETFKPVEISDIVVDNNDYSSPTVMQ